MAPASSSRALAALAGAAVVVIATTPDIVTATARRALVRRRRMFTVGVVTGGSYREIGPGAITIIPVDALSTFVTAASRDDPGPVSVAFAEGPLSSIRKRHRTVIAK